jgi:hypothetical protein
LVCGQRLDLGHEFLTEVEQVLAVIEASPSSFPRLDGPSKELVVRRALMPRFPYAIIFLVLQAEIRVLGVAHAKRRPSYWLDRVMRESD